MTQQPLTPKKPSRKKRNGFFIEAGAAHGTKLSNTFIFEHLRNVTPISHIVKHSKIQLFFALQWTGLLVEPNPHMYPNLRDGSGRKAVCLV